MKFLKLSIAAIVLVFFTTANASIVDVNSQGGVSSLFLTAGTYDVNPIGQADGGAYNSWNPWGNATGCGVDGKCSTGWVHIYDIDSSEFSDQVGSLSSGSRYQTSLLALENAAGYTFTLSSDGNVDFSIFDTSTYDNQGGVSLEINQLSSVPVPAAVWLFGSGLIGLIGVARRKAT